jgi:hypothetical protein
MDKGDLLELLKMSKASKPLMPSNDKDWPGTWIGTSEATAPPPLGHKSWCATRQFSTAMLNKRFGHKVDKSVLRVRRLPKGPKWSAKNDYQKSQEGQYSFDETKVLKYSTPPSWTFGIKG